MNPIDHLKSVLCDPTGKCCIQGSDEDREIVDRALQALAEQPAQQQEPVAYAKDLIEGLYENGDPVSVDAAELLEQLTAQQEPAPVQEPVVRWDSDGWGDLLVDSLPDGTLLYTSPPAQRTWVGLTEQEKATLIYEYRDTPVALCIETERKLKEKNT